jgi:acetylglutamate kinase
MSREAAAVKPIVIKLGGRAAEREQDMAALAAEIADQPRATPLLLVHGGGAEVTALSKTLGMEAVFKDGIRQTSRQEMDVVDMVLAGRLNKHLVRILRVQGVNPVGLSGSDGGTFTGVPAGGGATATRTGEVTNIDARLINLLLSNGYLPVICSSSTDSAGVGLNINADTVAFRLAAHLAAAALVFLSDIPGILSDGSVVQALSEAEARALIERGVIAGGMVPKVLASLDAMDQGVKKVIIGQYEGAGSLARLLDGKQGTRLWK